MDAADARSDAETNEAKGSSTDVLIVHIDGAVASPGVYELDKDARVQDAVVAAGGLSDSADTTALNLAAKLSDGQKIHIPDEGEVQTAQSLQSGSSTESYVSGTNDLININSASIDELDSLPGVGPSTAAAIVSDREKLGSFSSIEDLMRVSGIGEKKFEKLKDYICV